MSHFLFLGNLQAAWLEGGRPWLELQDADSEGQQAAQGVDKKPQSFVTWALSPTPGCSTSSRHRSPRTPGELPKRKQAEPAVVLSPLDLQSGMSYCWMKKTAVPGVGEEYTKVQIPGQNYLNRASAKAQSQKRFPRLRKQLCETWEQGCIKFWQFECLDRFRERHKFQLVIWVPAGHKDPWSCWASGGHL